MTRRSRKKIGIIGLGATGLAFLYHLSKRIFDEGQMEAFEILIFDPSKRIPRGLAYGQEHKNLVLNMRANTMSICSNDLEHFLRNKTDDTESYEDQDYFPRKVFGDYLEQVLDQILKSAEEKHLTIKNKKEEAVDIESDAQGFNTVKTEKGTFKCDKIILCTGNAPTALYSEFKGTKGYFSSPYADDSIKTIPDGESVVILGSSLTAVDAALLIEDKKHMKMTFVSRNGQLPKVQGPAHKYAPRVITRETIQKLTENFTRKMTLDEVFRLFKEELGEDVMNWVREHSKVSDQKTELKEMLKSAERDDLKYQQILASTSRLIPVIWSNMVLEDKIKFMERYYSLWCSVRHAMPLINAKKVYKLMEEKRLTVVGGLREVTYDEVKHCFIILLNDSKKQIEANYLINATGTCYSLSKIESALYQNLLRKKIVQEHPCGGIDVDFESFVVKNGLKKSQDIYAIGPLTRGVHFYTNAVEMNALHAEQLSELLYQEMKHEK